MKTLQNFTAIIEKEDETFVASFKVLSGKEVCQIIADIDLFKFAKKEAI